MKLNVAAGTTTPTSTATLKFTATCVTAGTQTADVTITNKNVPTQKRTATITITCTQAKPKASIAPNPINITAPVGSTASGSFTLENSGDVDSTLDYIVYRPGQTASIQVAASTPISTRALPPGSGFPGPVGSVDTRFTSPSETTGSLLKTSATTAASTSIPVSATCSTVGSFSSVIEVTYATGDLTPSGTPVFASSDMTVDVLCTGAIYSGDQGDSTIYLETLIGQTIDSSPINYSNTGIASSSDPATLTTSMSTNVAWLTVTPSSSSVAPGNGSSFVITASCVSLDVGTHSGVVILSTNTGKTFSWIVNLTCTGSPKIAVNPTALNLKARVNASVTSSFVVFNNGDANLLASMDLGNFTFVSFASSGLIAPHSSGVVNLTTYCGSVVEVRTDRIRIFSNDPVTPVLDVLVTLTCTDLVLSGPTSAKMVSSDPSWAPPTSLSIPIQNSSSESGAYTASLFASPYVKIVGGAGGVFTANSTLQIDLVGTCPSSSTVSDFTLSISVDDAIRLSVPVTIVCAPILHAAIVVVDALDCGAKASVLTYQPYPDWLILVGGYSNLITLPRPCLGPSNTDEAMVKGKEDADAHLFVPAEGWELPCRSAYWAQSVTACRREQWANAKARFDALTTYIR